MFKVQGFCEEGNVTVSIASTGYTSSNKVQGSFPACTITVFDAGTLNLATIYSDNEDPPTVKGNPFTAGADGIWYFYAELGLYDIKFSGAGIPIPFTLGAISVGDSIISLVDFSPTYDGTSDNAVPLTKFVKAVMASRNRYGIMPDGVFCTSIQLPTINVDGVKIIGCGPSGDHNQTPIASGTVIKWIGATGGGATMWEVSPDEGASNQYLQGVHLEGITLDCDSKSDYGWIIKTMRQWRFDCAAFNARVVACLMDVVTLSGDPRDLQRGEISFVGRQWEYATGISLKLNGDSGANVSLNNFRQIDILYRDAVAIDSVNPDHNTWDSVRLFKHPAGTSAYSWLWRGGATQFNVTRAEVVHNLSASDPIHAGGTDEYAFPSYSNYVLMFDSEDSGFSQAIVRGTGALAWFSTDKTPIWDGVWTPYTPTITPETGAFTTLSQIAGRYQRTPHGINVYVAFKITTLGTAGGNFITATLPVDCSPDSAAIIVGKEPGISGKMVCGWIQAGGSSMLIQDYTGAFLGVNGSIYVLTGHYETYEFAV